MGSHKEQRLMSFSRWLVTGLALAAIPFCIALVDRPLTEFMVAHQLPELSILVRVPRIFFLLAVAAPFFAGKARGAPPRSWKNLFALLSFSVLWTMAVVELILKRLAGRLDPDAWLYRHQYGFHWFAGRSPRFQSFPSGEAALLMAVIGIFWVLYPKARWLYVAAFLLEGIALVTLRWHFASDVLAGGLVGVCGAALAFRFVERA